MIENTPAIKTVAHADGSVEYKVGPNAFGPHKIRVIKRTHKSPTWTQEWTYALHSLRIWPDGLVLVDADRVCRKGDSWQQVGKSAFFTTSSRDLREVVSL